MPAAEAGLPLFPAEPPAPRTWRASCETCGAVYTSAAAENPDPRGFDCPLCGRGRISFKPVEHGNERAH
jgi:rubredoxin